MISYIRTVHEYYVRTYVRMNTDAYIIMCTFKICLVSYRPLVMVKSVAEGALGIV